MGLGLGTKGELKSDDVWQYDNEDGRDESFFAAGDDR